LPNNEQKPAIEALTEEMNKVAIERLGDAIATAVQTADTHDRIVCQLDARNVAA
jgi:DNA-binding protein